MRSEHADAFNHDDQAASSDADVADESNPIRTGYDAALAWVVEQAAAGPGDVVADLGAGTGNLAVRFGDAARLICVDVSPAMLAIARTKLEGRRGVEYVVTDLLGFVVDSGAELDVIATTYAAHHLTAAEKETFIAAARARLQPGGRLVVGDLMAAHRAAAAVLTERLDHPDVADLFADEFPWWVDESVALLNSSGFVDIRSAQLSELSWGLAATAA